jgi:hypothetical protein
MASFSPTDVAFEGFRLTRERPRAVVAWASCYLVFTFAVALVADLTLGARSQALLGDFQRAASDPAAFWAAAQKLAPFFLAGLPLSLAFQSIFTCAVYRAVLRPRDARTGYLRLGMDEVRMCVLNVILSLLWGAIIFAVLMVTILAADTAGTTATSGMVLLGDAATLVMVGGGITVLVRISLAGPITFAERRLRIFESWRLTRGSFWRLFWAYLLTFLLGIVVLLLMLLILNAAAGVIAQVSGVPLDSLSNVSPNPLIVLGFFVYQAATVVVLTCFWVVWKAAPAQAYKDITGGRYPP